MGETSPARPTRSLSQHYNASQLRLDTWNRLREASGRLVSAEGTAAAERLRRRIEDALETLQPIERYWAFPGKDVLVQLSGLFERGEFQLLATTVNHVVRMLSSDLYRSVTGEEPARLEKLGGDAYSRRFTRSRSERHDRHYFEILFVDDLDPVEERGLRERLQGLVGPEDRYVFDVVVVPSFEDALIAVLLNHNIQTCIIRNSFPLRSPNELEVLQPYLETIEGLDLDEHDAVDLGVSLGRVIKSLRPELDLFLVSDSTDEDVATRIHEDFRRVFYRQDDYTDLYLSIRRGIMERYDTPFFFALKEYSQRPMGVFHAMPLSRGNSIAKSHWIQDMGAFYGRNIFLAETSATTGGLDSLLQPTGALKKAQALAARAFGSRQTFFVTNGTSTANKIVVQSLVRPGDIVLIDRDCHKSHHYAMVLSGALPIYLDSYPIDAYSMYGAVPLREIKSRLLELKRSGQLDRVSMLLLTNCTFDGLVYNVERVMEEVLAIKPDMVFLWDEAWFAFAGFTPTYRRRTAMHTAERLCARYESPSYRTRYEAFVADRAGHEDDDAWLLDHHLLPDPERVKVRAYATHSTHKKLSSLRQGSMIHVWDEEFKLKVEDAFSEAYMTHTSTSPSYQILASLDLARRQAELEGYEMVQKSVEMAMSLRARITDHPLLSRYFRILTLEDMIPDAHRASGLQRYYDSETGWQRMEAAWRDDEFVLDPTHVTLFIGATGVDGDTFKNEFLMDQFGIQVNKTSRNTVLFMANIGTTRSALAYLVGVLVKIAKQLETRERAMGRAERVEHERRIWSLTEELPPLPDFSEFHAAFRPHAGLPAGDLRSAYFMAYVDADCEYLKLDGTVQRALDGGREVVAASFVIPYPPGFPILVPGQLVSQRILSFMKALDVKEIHGYRPGLGLKVFTEAALRDRVARGALEGGAGASAAPTAAATNAANRNGGTDTDTAAPPPAPGRPRKRSKRRPPRTDEGSTDA
ncbi:MAG: ornithine decarboxylase [Trueperaceae bacterium]|nr:ornithine decarboxylase [Trueperaceae bacterium]